MTWADSLISMIRKPAQLHFELQLSPECAAHAGCFAMALSLILGNAGFKPDYVDATAHVTVLPQDGAFKITKSHLVCEARVPGIDQVMFAQHAQTAKAGCPVSQALAGTEITLEDRLVANDSKNHGRTS